MSALIKNNSFNCQYKLLGVRSHLKSGNEEKAIQTLSSISPNVQEKIHYYTRKILGRQAADKTDKLPFGKASSSQKKDAIDRYLLHFVKQQLKQVSKLFDENEEMKAFKAFAILGAFSKEWDIINDFHHDIYFLTWKILEKKIVGNCSPEEFGEGAFWDISNCFYGINSAKRSKCLNLYSQSLKHYCYINDACLKISNSAKVLFFKTLRNRTHLQIEGDKTFHRKVICDIYTILTVPTGQSLLQQIFDINIEKQIKIVLNNSCAESKFYFIDLKVKKIEFCVIGVPENDLGYVKVHMDENGKIHPLVYSSAVVLAHELLHVLWKSKFPELRDQPSTAPKLYPHAEEEAVITGNLGNFNIQYPISENAIRKDLQLPSRLGHLAFPTPKSIFEACQFGFIVYIQEFLDKGKCVNSVDSSFGNKQSLLHIVAGSEYFKLFPDNFKKVVDLLISKGALLEALDSLDQTPLHLAAKEVISKEPESEIAYLYLLSKGSNPEAENCVRKKPVQYYEAFKKGRVVI